MASSSSASPSGDAAPARASSLLQSLRAFAAGGVGGICAVVVGHPFDLVKVRLQTAAPGVYRGVGDVVRKAVIRDGPIRVSRGNWVPQSGQGRC